MKRYVQHAVACQPHEHSLALAPRLDLILTLSILAPRQDQYILRVERRYDVVPFRDSDEARVVLLLGLFVHSHVDIFEVIRDRFTDIVQRHRGFVVV